MTDHAEIEAIAREWISWFRRKFPRRSARYALWLIRGEDVERPGWDDVAYAIGAKLIEWRAEDEVRRLALRV